MSVYASLPVLAVMLSAALPLIGSAAPFPLRERIADFDKRQRPAESASVEKGAALTQLQARLPTIRVELDPLLQGPRFIRATDGFLTGTNGGGRSVALSTAATFAPGQSHASLKAFLSDHRALFGYGFDRLERARLRRQYTSPHNGMQTAVWAQEYNDLPVFEAQFIAHTTKDGALVSLSSGFVADLEQASRAGASGLAPPDVPTLTARQAAANAAMSLGQLLADDALRDTGGGATGVRQQHRFQAPGFNQDIDCALIWLPMSADRMRLCWEVLLTLRARGETYRVLVDARDGNVLIRRCLTLYLSDAVYRVFTSDSPSPFSPGHSTVSNVQPPLVGRSLVTWSALDTNASPNGWIDDGDNETRGNNVDAHLDRDGNDQADLPRPQGTPFRVFDFPLDLMQTPSSYSEAAVVQLFYWCNWMHDRLYQLGFTEAAGNFQNDNFGRGGLGNDAVLADAQDGSGSDNANFTPQPDGVAPRIQMFLWSWPIFFRDGDLDAEIVLHEYTHGLSDRLVGGGVGMSELQSQGLGEGWSDFYALALLSEASDDLGANYAMGGYVTHRYFGLQQNYYFGIRRYPYSTNLTTNPLTFKDIDPAQASAHSPVPLNPLDSPFSASNADEVHNQGEVWCVTLWEMRARLIAKHGFSIGNPLALQLTTDGLKLSPPNPTFVEARDAILLADRINTGGANDHELWSAFAKRGLGTHASAPASYTTAGVVEAFDIPDTLRVFPAAGFVASKPAGGLFNVTNQSCRLENAGTNSLAWRIGSPSSWLTITPTNGVLDPGVPSFITVSLNTNAHALPVGVHTAAVLFTNLQSGQVQRRDFTARVAQPDYFTELFNSANTPLAGQTITFRPDGSPSVYAACREFAKAFPSDPTGGNIVSLTDDSFAPVTLAGAAQVSVYGRRGSALFIGSNGYLTMDAGDTSFRPLLPTHFNQPRVSAFFQDLNPGVGGTVSWKQLSNRVAVTWLNVPEYSAQPEVGISLRTNSFQIELFFDGGIRMTWLHLGSIGGLAGLSPGTGVPYGFVESDLGGYPLCFIPLAVTLPASALEGAGLLSARGEVWLPTPATNDVVVSLFSSDLSELLVPASVTVLRGQTNALFDLTLPDDSELDGIQRPGVLAIAPGYGDGVGSMSILDNETAVLSLVLPPSAREGDGNIQGSVRVSAAPVVDILVELISSQPSEVQTSAAIIRAGQTSAVCTVTIVDDGRIDGAQTVELTARVANWTDGTTTLNVLDNEGTTLTLLLPAQVVEGSGIRAGAAVVQTPGALPTNLVLSLVCQAPSRVGVPSTVLLPAGRTNTYFDLVIADNSDPEGAVPVLITASAPGFDSVTNGLSVLDDDVHHFRLSFVPSPQYTNAPFPLSVSARDAADQLLSAYSGTVSLQSTGDVSNILYEPAFPLLLTNGQWAGSASLNTKSTHVRLFATNSAGISGQSALFNVERNPIRILNLSVGDLGYDTAGARILATGTNGSIAHQLLAIDPINGVVSTAVPLAPNPSRLAVVANGQFLYVNFNSNDSARTVSLPELTVGNPFMLGGPIVDMEPNPTNPFLLIVARNSDIAMFNNGVLQPNRAGPSSSVIEIGIPPSVLYGGPSPITQFTITAVGVTFVRSFEPPAPAARLGTDMKFAGGFLYYSLGAVIDPANQSVAGIFPVSGTSALVRPDVALGRVFFLASTGTNWLLQSFDRSTLLPLKSLPIPGIQGTPTSLIRWGTNGLAFRTSGGQIFLVQASSLVPSGTLPNLVATQVTIPASPSVGETFACVVTVTNRGPVEASGVTLTLSLPSLTIFQSADVSQGEVTRSGDVLTSQFGILPPNTSATLTWRASAFKPGWATNLARVVANEANASPSNNVTAFGFGFSIQFNPSDATPIKQLALLLTDCLYHGPTDRLYATVPPSVPLLGNTLTIIDPRTGAISPGPFLGPNCGQLVSSRDGQFLYAAISNGLAIRRVDMTTLTPGPPLVLGNGLTALDLDVSPENPRLLAVCRSNNTAILYENGIARSNVLNGLRELKFSDSGSLLFGLGADSGLQRAAVTSNGLTLLAVGYGLFGGYDRDMQECGGLLYGSTGPIVDPHLLKSVGSMPGLENALTFCAAPAESRVYYLNGNNPTAKRITAMDPLGLSQQGQVSISGLVGTPAHLVRWGSTGLAFNTEGGQVYLLNSSLIPTQGPADLGLTLNSQPNVGTVGQPLTQTFTLTNHGPGLATGVVVQVRIPSSLTLVRTASSAGTCLLENGLLICRPGDLRAGDSVTLLFAFTLTKPNPFEVVADAGSSAPDPVLSNNILRKTYLTQQRYDGMIIRRIVQPNGGVHWDATSQRMFVTFPHSSPTNADALMVLDTASGEFVGPLLSPGRAPGRMTSSPDGQFLYVSTESGLRVRRIHLPTATLQMEFPVDDVNAVPQMMLTDWQTLPGQPGSIAITRGAPMPLIIFDDGVPRPGFTAVSGYNLAIPPLGDQIYATFGGRFERWNLGPTGITLDRLVPDMFDYGAGDAVLDTGLVFGADGTIVDPEGPVRLARVPVTSYPAYAVAPWVSEGRVFFLRADNHQIDTFDLFTQQRLRSTPFPPFLFGLPDFQHWGTNGLVFRSTNAIWLVDGAVSDVPPEDGDSDGLPDAWELQFFGSLGALRGGPTDDYDSDGQTNLAEFRAGTNPNDARARFEVSKIEFVNGIARLEFPTALGRIYRVERTQRFVDAWLAVSADLPGTGSHVSFVDAPPSTQLNAFYRVLVVYP